MAAAATLAASAAGAVPVMVTYEDVVGVGAGTTMPNVTLGDAFRIELVLDNGWDSLANQVYGFADLLSVTITAGTAYSAAMDSFYRTNAFDLTTDASGALASLTLERVVGFRTDTNENPIFWFYLNGRNNVLFAGDGYVHQIGAEAPPDLSNTSIAFASALPASAALVAVPLPAAGWLMLAGLGALGMRRLR